MLKKVADFLAKHWEKNRPLLLGYSGGPDSKALLYALLEAGCKTVHLAHLDHGWREESAQEAAALEEEAKGLGLPFFTCRLNLETKGELAGREARLTFFRSLFKKVPFQALLLAHQADDRAETVLKRVLEGAHLPFLGGMEPTGQFQGMNVWRPLLTVKKEEIQTFLKEKNLDPFIDPTNFDPAYLRAKMRIEIFPWITKHFGKGIANNLSLLSDRAYELKAYLENKTKELIPDRGPWGISFQIAHLERIEARFLLQKWAEKENLRLSRHLLELTLDAAFSKSQKRKIGPRIVVERGTVFFLKSSTHSMPTS
jgi:tRNA(Ile)-lysidine synthase